MPRMRFVESSSIEAVGYDAEPGRLYVKFRESGETYVYYGVEARLFNDFIQADSKGQYFNSFIRDRYPYERLSL